MNVPVPVAGIHEPLVPLDELERYWMEDGNDDPRRFIVPGSSETGVSRAMFSFRNRYEIWKPRIAIRASLAAAPLSPGCLWPRFPFPLVILKILFRRHRRLSRFATSRTNLPTVLACYLWPGRWRDQPPSEECNGRIARKKESRGDAQTGNRSGSVTQPVFMK